MKDEGKNAGGDASAPRGAPGNADVPVGKSAKGAPQGWYSRGYLPHLNSQHITQSITYRLADSLPKEKLETLEKELAKIPSNRREAQRRRRIEEWLDAGMGCCALGHPEVASYVEDSFKHFHGDRYQLLAWCIMPNHVHVLIEPQYDLAKIVQGWKSFTSRWILAQNERLGLQIPKQNQLWMRKYWDRYIRDADHFRSVVDYIHQNPVKAGLFVVMRGSGAGLVFVLIVLMGMPTETPALPGTSALPDYD